MPRRQGKESIYEVAAAFRDGCLGRGTSLLWPSQKIWTVEAVQSLIDAFVDAPDLGGGTFYEKFRDQLQTAPVGTHRVAADILAFYLLFSTGTSAETKLQRLEQVIDWKVDQSPEIIDLVKRAFEEGGIGFPGANYQTGQPWQITFFIKFCHEVIRRRIDPTNHEACRTLAYEVENGLDHKSGSGPNVLLHLFFPDRFERVASTRHKRAIAGLLTGPSSGELDSDVDNVRAELSARLGRADFDFYDEDVKKLWHPSVSPEENEERVSPEPRVWIEKTLVEGRPDRIAGEYALGKALWSPERDRSGKDIYRFMRDVRPGDLVLHLTDNDAVTGLSEAASSFETFGGVPGTVWEGPCYLVRLRNFRKLAPPLHRAVFFSPPHVDRLLALYDEGERNLFYNRKGELNQGKYLTAAPDQLVEVLVEAYASTSGKSLFEEEAPLEQPGEEIPRIPTAGSTLADIHRNVSAALREARLVFGADHDSIVRAFLVGLATKRFVILTGLSGSGKTQLALRFGDWLGENHRRLIPVRPDWTGSEAIFGFEDMLQAPRNGKRAWHVSEPLEFMLAAARDPTSPHLLILDEMNLAHVERYFADVLSGMESSQSCLPNLTREDDGSWRLQNPHIPKLPLPTNLLIAGTVNVDETTYLFSPKVLDRANTFEFRVQTTDLPHEAVRPGAVRPGDPGLVSMFLQITNDDGWHLEHPASHQDDFVRGLRQVHALLTEGGFEFGHRVFFEAVRFASLLSAAGDDDPYSALDYQILQKVLPRLHGSRRRLEAPLCALARYCFDLTFEPMSARPGAPVKFDPLEAVGTQARLRRSFDKAQRMTMSLRANQFTSFTE